METHYQYTMPGGNGGKAKNDNADLRKIIALADLQTTR